MLNYEEEGGSFWVNFILIRSFLLDLKFVVRNKAGDRGENNGINIYI
jgi:hypothetical protein